ncbi:MAG: hypothetical protein Q8N66_14445 [Bacteroidota bacterium]|nr:hypothetical protein [Bacteroidota bacterium]
MSTEIEISPYGNMLIFKKGYTPDFVKETILQRNLDGLRIFDHLDKLNSLDFLKDYTFLKKLDIDCIDDQEYDFLLCLTNLHDLGIGLSRKEKNVIDLSNLTNLENLSIQWRKGRIKGLENCKRLRSLCLVDFKEENFLPIKELKDLKDLKVKTSLIKTTNGLENLVCLSNVLFGNCKTLKSIAALNGNENLKSIIIDHCSQIEDYTSLTFLPNIESIQIIDCKGVKSIKFIQNLHSLKKLVLLGTTDVLDGDITPAQEVKEVIYRHRKHYNIKIENLENDELIIRNLEKIKQRNIHKE